MKNGCPKCEKLPDGKLCPECELGMREHTMEAAIKDYVDLANKIIKEKQNGLQCRRLKKIKLCNPKGC